MTASMSPVVQFSPSHSPEEDGCSLTFAGGQLFAFGTSRDSRSGKISGSGLTAYDAGGIELYHRYGRQPIGGVTAVSPGVLVGGSQRSAVFRREDVLEPAIGRVPRMHASRSSC